MSESGGDGDEATGAGHPTGEWRPDPDGVHEFRYFVRDEPTGLVSDSGEESLDDHGEWVPDPTGRHEFRYFVSGKPTSAVSDHGVHTVDEPPAPPPVGVQPESPEPTVGTAAVEPEPVEVHAAEDSELKPKEWMKEKKVLLLVGAGALAVVLGIGIALVSSGDDSSVQGAAPGAGDAVETTAPPETTSTTEAPPGPQLDVEGSVEVIDADSVEITGSTDPGVTVRAVWAGDEATATTGPQGNFTVVVGGLAEGNTNVRLTAENEDGGTASSTVIVTRSISEELFKFLTRQIPYDELVRDPDSLAGQTVNYRAQVFQYDSRTTTSSMLVWVTEGEFSFWTDNVLLTLDPAVASNIDNDDIIRFWGTVAGSQTYDTAGGGSNTVPVVDVEYMELESKG